MDYRYYIGLHIPDPLAEQITAIQQELLDTQQAMVPLEPHLTLLPPPAVIQIPPDRLGPQAAAAAAPFLPMQLMLGHLESFRGRTFAIAVHGTGLLELQAALTQLLPTQTPVSYYPQRRFTPHITLVQAKRGLQLSKSLLDAYHHAVNRLLPVEITIDHLTLYRWKRPRIYEAETL